MPEGPCPDCREAVAADISLVASSFCVLGPIFVADEFVDGTTGAIRRAAIDRNARNSGMSFFNLKTPPLALKRLVPFGA